MNSLLSLRPLAALGRSRVEARLAKIRAEAEQPRSRVQRSRLRYELGVLLEHGLLDQTAAVREYLESYNLNPEFRPSAEALLRIFDLRGDHRNRSRVLEAQKKNSSDTETRNYARVELLLHALRTHGDPSGVNQPLAEPASETQQAVEAAVLSYAAFASGDQTLGSLHYGVRASGVTLLELRAAFEVATVAALLRGGDEAAALSRIEEVTHLLGDHAPRVLSVWELIARSSTAGNAGSLQRMLSSRLHSSSVATPLQVLDATELAFRFGDPEPLAAMVLARKVDDADALATALYLWFGVGEGGVGSWLVRAAGEEGPILDSALAELSAAMIASGQAHSVGALAQSLEWALWSSTDDGLDRVRQLYGQLPALTEKTDSAVSAFAWLIAEALWCREGPENSVDGWFALATRDGGVQGAFARRAQWLREQGKHQELKALLARVIDQGHDYSVESETAIELAVLQIGDGGADRVESAVESLSSLLRAGHLMDVVEMHKNWAQSEQEGSASVAHYLAAARAALYSDDERQAVGAVVSALELNIKSRLAGQYLEGLAELSRDEWTRSEARRVLAIVEANLGDDEGAWSEIQERLVGALRHAQPVEPVDSQTADAAIHNWVARVGQGRLVASDRTPLGDVNNVFAQLVGAEHVERQDLLKATRDEELAAEGVALAKFFRLNGDADPQRDAEWMKAFIPSETQAEFALDELVRSIGNLERKRQTIRHVADVEGPLQAEFGFADLVAQVVGGLSPDDAFLIGVELEERVAGNFWSAWARFRTTSPDESPEERAAILATLLAYGCDSLPYQLERIRCLFSAERYAEVVAAGGALLSQYPDEPALLEMCRAAAKETGHFELSVQMCDRLAKLSDPESSAEYQELAAELVLDAFGDVGDARVQVLEQVVERLSVALELYPERALSLELLRDALIELERPAELLPWIERAVTSVREPQRKVQLLFEKAVVQRALGQQDQASEALSRLLEMTPDHLGALTLRIEIESSRGQYPKVVEDLRALARLEVLPPSQRAIAVVGAAEILYASLGQPQEAAELLAEELDQHAASDASLLWAADVLKSVAMGEKALSLRLAAARRLVGTPKKLALLELLAPYREILDVDALYEEALFSAAVPGQVDYSVEDLVPLFADPEFGTRRAQRFLMALFDETPGWSPPKFTPAWFDGLMSAWTALHPSDVLLPAVLRSLGESINNKPSYIVAPLVAAPDAQVGSETLAALRFEAYSHRIGAFVYQVAEVIRNAESVSLSTLGVERRDRVPESDPMLALLARLTQPLGLERMAVWRSPSRIGLSLVWSKGTWNWLWDGAPLTEGTFAFAARQAFSASTGYFALDTWKPAHSYARVAAIHGVLLGESIPAVDFDPEAAVRALGRRRREELRQLAVTSAVSPVEFEGWLSAARRAEDLWVLNSTGAVGSWLETRFTPTGLHHPDFGDVLRALYSPLSVQLRNSLNLVSVRGSEFRSLLAGGERG